MTRHMLLNISRFKGNQTVKSGQLIEIEVEIFVFKNYAEIEAGKLVPDSILFFKKALYQVKAGLQLGFTIFR